MLTPPYWWKGVYLLSHLKLDGAPLPVAARASEKSLLAEREGFEPSHRLLDLTPQQGVPLQPLGYHSNYINYEIKKQPYGWCKKLLIDIVFCSICFRNIWKRIFIPLTILLWNYMLFIVGLWIAQNPRYPSVIPHRNQPGSITSYVTMHLVQRVQLSLLVGRARVERASSVFQTGAPTLYAIVP